MAKRVSAQRKFFAGISGGDEKSGLDGSAYFMQGLNITRDPNFIQLNPEAVKDSGTTVVDQIKWIVAGSPHNTNLYSYGDGGRIYQRTAAGAWSVLRTVASSVGQGFEVFNDYLYYTQNTQLGRYGLLSGVPAFSDNFQTGLNDTSTTGFAPLKAFFNRLCVGHGRHLGTYDGTTWDPDRLAIDRGYSVRTLSVYREFLVIGAWRGTSVTDSEQGYLYFWDGTAADYNFKAEIPEGGVTALLNTRNRILSAIGSAGNLYLETDPFQNIERLPFLEFNKIVDVYPGAMTNYRGLAHIGVAGLTDSAAIYQGVYTWGAIDARYPEVLNFAYPISTGTTQATTVKVSAVYGLGDELYIAWRDGGNYGVDRVLNTNDPQATGFIEGLLFDDLRPFVDKLAIKLKATHKALVTGESVQLSHKVNRAANYTNGTANSTVGSTETELSIPLATSRFREFQWKCTLATTGVTSPTVTSVGLLYDDLEGQVGEF